MTKATALLMAARPKTLPAAVCPVVAGSALAWRLEHTFSWMLAVATVLSTIAIQVATNYFNDAVDAAKGADTTARLGPVRATAAGLVSRKAMMVAGCVAALTAAGFAVPLVMERGWVIVLIGAVSLFFSYGYTGGPWPLAYRGLGEVFVMLFFGLVAVTGTVFVQTGLWRSEGLLLGIQIGALSTVLIAINNLRDIEEDTQSRKRTLAVRWGKKAARVMIGGWLLLPYAAGLIAWAGLGFSSYATSQIPALLLAAIAGGIVIRHEPSPIYNKALAISALHLLVWTALFVVASLRG